MPSKWAIGFLLLLWGCNSTSTVNNQETKKEENKPLVVATTSVICDLTKQIANTSIDLKCLVAAGVDPHIYQPKPEDRQAIDRARLILYAGYDFEPSLIKLVKSSSNTAPKIPIHETAVSKPLTGGHGHDHQEENKKSTDSTTPDPHVWHDPKNGIKMVEQITIALKQLQPNQANIYDSNRNKIIEELTALDKLIKSQIDTIPANKRKLVTTHDSLGYYVKAYGLKFEGALTGLSSEEQPTAGRISELVKDIKKTGVPTIFAESSINPKLINTIAKEANVKVAEKKLYTDGLGELGSDGETYQKMLLANTKTIVEGLK